MEKAKGKIENPLLTNDDSFVFVPEDIIVSLEHIYDKMKVVQQEFNKVAEAMKPVRNS
jgi:hypothetical protein